MGPRAKPRALTAEEFGARLDARWPRLHCCFLGETDHFAEGRNGLVLQAVDALLLRGHGRIAIEMGRHDAQHLDRYLRGGDEDDLRRPALWSLAEAPSTGAAGHAWVRGERAFWRSLRRCAQRHLELGHLAGGDLSVVGYDLEQAPGAALASAFQQASGATQGGELRDRIATLQRPAGANLEQRARSAADVLEEARDRPNPDPRLLEALEDACRSLEHHAALARAGSDPLARARVQERREGWLARRLIEALTPAAPSAPRSVVLGHAFHLTRSNAPLFWGPIGSDLRHWDTAGASLHNALTQAGRATAVTWLLFGSGRRRAPGSNPTTVHPAPGSLERQFAAGACPALIDLAQLEGDQAFTANGAPAHGALADLADLALFAH